MESDATLLSRYAKDRDAQAFAEIVRRYASMVFGVARRITINDHDAEDITQTCFMDLTRQAGRINSSAAGWLYTAATHRALNLRRERTVRRRREESFRPPAVDTEDWARVQPLVDAALVELPEELRVPIILHFLQGKSQLQVAEELGASQPTISRRIESGVEQLRSRLKETGVVVGSGALLGSMLANESAHAAPPGVVAMLGKMGLAGMGGARIVRERSMWSIAQIIAGIVVIVAVGIVLVEQVGNSAKTPAPNPPVKPVVTTGLERDDPMNNQVHRENGRVWIEGTVPLAWGKSGETTFCGALASALAPRAAQAPMRSTTLNMKRALDQAPRLSGPDYDYITLMGVSALAFRVRWYQGSAGHRWSGAGPVGEMVEERDRVGLAIGMKLEGCGVANPIGPEPIQEITNSIDHGFPVLAYLSPHLDMGLIYGYENSGQSFLMRDYYIGDDISPRPAAKLGGFLCFLRPGGTPAAPVDSALAAFEVAEHNWTRDDRPKFDEENGEFFYGLHAYEKWIGDLSNPSATSGDERQKLFQATWWNFDSLDDARRAAEMYLDAIAPRFGPPAADHLRTAADLYRQEIKLTGDIFAGREMFLGPWSGKTIEQWTPEVRGKEIEILKKLRLLDEKAIAELKAAVESL